MQAAASLSARIAAARRRIAAAAQRSGRSPGDVTLVAVTKTLPAEVVAEAFRLGLTTFGENRVQEGVGKRAALNLAGVSWELIGHLQTNKVAAALAAFERIQSVDSLRLAQALSARAAASGGRDVPILLEVNVAAEATKGGFAPEELPGVARQIVALPHLRVEGLMTVAPIAGQGEQTRPVFVALRALRDRLRHEAPSGPGGGWRELSMGMSDDFEVAIEEGATLVRLGRVLFGERPPIHPG
jgi:pyridoxal phosphate enzyme (YggS family)